jgi:hypothetical protein
MVILTSSDGVAGAVNGSSGSAENPGRPWALVERVWASIRAKRATATKWFAEPNGVAGGELIAKT